MAAINEINETKCDKMTNETKDKTIVVIEPSECPICFSAYGVDDNEEFVLSCQCSFCHDCLLEYIDERIGNGLTNIACPNTNCNVFMTYEEVQKIGGDAIYERFLVVKLNQVIATDPRRTWCPVPDCNTICSVIETETNVDGLSGKTRIASCLKCHHEFSPDEIIKELMPWKILELNPNTKMCPKCNVLIERNGGCPQIFCRYCLSVVQIEKGEIQVSLKSAFKQYIIKITMMIFSLIGLAISIKFERQELGIFFGIMFTLLFNSDYDDGPDYMAALWNYRKIHKRRIEEEGLQNIILETHV